MICGNHVMLKTILTFTERSYMINIVFRRNTQVRLKGSVLKTDRGLTARGVRIPLPPPSIFILNTIYNEGKCSNFEYLPFYLSLNGSFLAIEMIGH